MSFDQLPKPYLHRTSTSGLGNWDVVKERYILSSEILPWGDYTIFRKDRKSRAGGVLLAVKSTTFSSCREINFDVDLELVTVEIVSKSNMKHLVCCCYKPPQNVNKQWLESFNLFLAKSCATYHNVLLCGDLNFPNIPWYSPELATFLHRNWNLERFLSNV